MDLRLLNILFHTASAVNASNHSVSLWETGSTLSDISILVELAKFYEVDSLRQFTKSMYASTFN